MENFRSEDIDEQKDFMMGDCLSCSVTNLSLFNFGGSICESSGSDVSDDAEGIKCNLCKNDIY